MWYRHTMHLIYLFKIYLMPDMTIYAVSTVLIAVSQPLTRLDPVSLFRNPNETFGGNAKKKWKGFDKAVIGIQTSFHSL